MSINLLSFVKDQISDEAISSIGSLIGENSSVTKNAISSALPTILKGIINRGDTTQNATALRKYIGEHNLGTNAISALLGANTKDKKESFLSKGSGIIDFLFGSAKSSLLNNMSNAVGLASGKSNMLSQAIAPIALSAVSKLAATENFSDEQLGKYLDSQKGIFADHTVSNTSHTNKEVKTERVVHHEESGTGMGWLKWLLPLLLIGGLIWWFLGRGSNPTDTVERTPKVEQVVKQPVEQVTTKTVESVNKTVGETAAVENKYAGNADFRFDANGNIIDANGNIISKAGEFSEINGYYTDAQGRRIGLVSKIGTAISGAAVKTADTFKNVFTGLFKSKEKIGNKYTLSEIEFDDESHKITNFSKNEVEGLASALKSLPGAKIQVQVHSTDGDNNKQNKEFTNLRAEVVRDMLVTLGVGKKQISFKGMGDENPTKASAEKVEIMVEQTAN